MLIPNQFGFRKHHSTDYAILQLLCDKIIESFSNKEHLRAIFMDLSKAFDTIDHQKNINTQIVFLWHQRTSTIVG